MNVVNEVSVGTAENNLVCLVNTALKKSEVYLPIKAVGRKIGFSDKAIKTWEKAGEFPASIVIHGMPRFLESEIEEWVDLQNPVRLAKLAEQKAVAQEAKEFLKSM